MPASVSQRRNFAGLWSQTGRRLRCLCSARQPLPAHLSRRDGHGGRLRLRACALSLGCGGTARAECRMVRISGATAEIVNTMIFPTQPDRLPVYAAQLLAFGGRPRLAFIDLQMPGLTEGRRASLRERARVVARRFDFLPPADDAPSWAVEFASGCQVFTRTTEPDALQGLRDACLQYLELWVELARAECDSLESGANPAAHAELGRWQSEHARLSPGTEYLIKVFGEEWAREFLHEFLYRQESTP
ncbi:MAG: hypothetical protein K2R98_25635 [Gemmataceae bacterium]|nr:hypothetical protein [Gemmataceae bacterium]